MLRCFAFLVAAALTLSAAELPVSRVVLYKNGLALYERSGAVKPGEAVRLEFKKAEMDDVLKTLVLSSSAGAITNLRYELDDPLDRRLADIGLSIPSGINLAALLDQMRGARITLGTASGPLEGVVVSGRVAQSSQPTQSMQRLELTFLTTAGELKVIDLDGVSSVKFADDRLQKRLTDALAAYQQAQSQERKSLWIETTGQGGSLMARYLVPAPMWKSAYRLAFTDKEDATIEGWAIVENKSDSDWNNVQLTVVSGRPISFISRLYEPRYVARQVLELAEAQNARPMEMNARAKGVSIDGIPAGAAGGVVGGMLANAPPPPGAPAPRAAMKAAKGRQQNAQMFQPSAGLVTAEVVAMNREEETSSVAPETEAEEAGELFEYHFSRPASVKAGESLLVPFVQQKITASQVYLWDASEGSHPQRAAKLSNNTGKTLDGGPVTVYTPEGYTGESLLSTFKAGDKRFLSFAVDLGTKVTSKFDTGSQVIRSFKAEHGVLTTKSVLEIKTTYTATNVDPKEKSVLVSHPLRGDQELVSPKPEEKSDQRYLFALAVPASGEAKVTVIEQRPLEESIGILEMAPDQIVAWMEARKLTPEAKQKLEALAAKKREISAAEADIKRLDSAIAALTADENRLRQNIQSLNYVASQKEQVEKWAADLAKKENTILDQQGRLADAHKRKSDLDSQLGQLVEKLSF